MASTSETLIAQQDKFQNVYTWQFLLELKTNSKGELIRKKQSEEITDTIKDTNYTKSHGSQKRKVRCSWGKKEERYPRIIRLENCP